jgi:hypothetical protein
MMTSHIWTKTGIEVEGFHGYREFDIDWGAYRWFLSVGYVVLTQEGERVKKDYTFEVTGVPLTKAKEMRTWIVNQLEVLEGII